MRDKVKESPITTIWTVCIKLKALVDLFSAASPEPPISEEAHKGISYILDDITADLKAAKTMLEEKENQLNV